MNAFHLVLLSKYVSPAAHTDHKRLFAAKAVGLDYISNHICNQWATDYWPIWLERQRDDLRNGGEELVCRPELRVKTKGVNTRLRKRGDLCRRPSRGLCTLVPALLLQDLSRLRYAESSSVRELAGRSCFTPYYGDPLRVPPSTNVTPVLRPHSALLTNPCSSRKSIHIP